MIIIFVSVLETILLLFHLVFYKTFIKVFDISGQHLIAFRILIGVLSISFITASLIAFKYNNLFTRVFYSVSAAWLGFLWFLVLASILVWIIFGISKITSLPFSAKLAAEVLFSLAMLIGLYGIVNAATIKIKKISIALPNLPQAWKGKTAVWISDNHLGQVWSKSASKRTVDKINRLNPDIVFVGGDLYDGTKVNLDYAINPYKNLHPQFGTYFVTGNHEEFTNKTKYLNAIAKVNMKILNNQLIDIEGLQIIGVDYNDSRNKEKLKLIYESLPINRSKPSVLLKHEPSNIEISEQAGINFQLSGHAHGGAQIRFPFGKVSKAIYKQYYNGLNQYKNLKVYTSQGTGTWGPPLRIGTQSEIVQITFE